MTGEKSVDFFTYPRDIAALIAPFHQENKCHDLAGYYVWLDDGRTVQGMVRTCCGEASHPLEGKV